MARRIVIAHELQAEREVLAHAPERHHPTCETILIHPGEIAATVDQMRPDGVIAQASAPTLQDDEGAAILLHGPEGQHAVLRQGGQVLHRIEQASFTHILVLLDQLLVA